MIDFVRRHLLTALCIAAVAALGAWVAETAAGARAIRRHEEEALRVTREILMCEQELAPTSTDAKPYLDLKGLMENGALARRQVTALEPLALIADLQVYRANGYLFVVTLLDEQDRPSAIGRRFKAYAWPEAYGRTGTVFFYTDSRGDIYQGENSAGRYQAGKPPFEEDPVRDQRKVKLQELDEKQFRNRWRLFERPNSNTPTGR